MKEKTNPNQHALETTKPKSKFAFVKKCFFGAINFGWALYRAHKIEEWILSFFQMRVKVLIVSL